MPQNKSVLRALPALEKDSSKKLGVLINGEAITAAQYLGRAEAQAALQLSINVPDPLAKYMVVALDLDAPVPFWTGLSPILHWIQPGLTVGKDGLLSMSKPFIANYIGPAPPPGSGPHRYSFFLFAEPSGFDGKAHTPASGKPLSNWYRVRYDLDAWMKRVGLSEPVAVKYFLSN